MYRERSLKNIEVLDVKTSQDRRAFIRYPRGLYRDDPHWSPPLDRDLQAFLDAEKNPFFERARAALFMTREKGQITGRIVAFENHNHNLFYKDRLGFFGFFECINDVKTAESLVGAASKWLGARGLKAVRGPLNFTLSDDFGILLPVENKNHAPPRPMQPYNPPYYATLLEACGLKPAKDCVAMAWNSNAEEVTIRPRVAFPEIKIRPVKLRPRKNFFRDLNGINDLYHHAWKDNWGFLPTSAAELRFSAERLLGIAEANLLRVAEYQGQIVGMALAVPDYNPILRKLQGRFRPWDVPKVLRLKRANQTAVLIALGVHASFRKIGLAEHLMQDLVRGNPRYKYWETDWILEENQKPQNLLARNFAAHYTKRFRIFETAL